MKESDLYLPLKSFLESKNYEVKAEVCDCDVMALYKDEEPLIVELKLNLNLDVLLQAVNRLTLSSRVYIGIPKDSKVFKKKRKESIKLLKMLSLGLILIDSKSVDVLVEPCEYKPRKSKQKKARLLNEFEKRVGDPNLGGMSTKKGVITAYRQKALKIANFLKENGETKASVISKELEEEKVRDIVYKNFYGWFERVGKGVYKLNSKGEEEIKNYIL